MYISLHNAKNYFLLAVDNVDNSLKKKRFYFKLLEISENQKMYDESLIYIIYLYSRIFDRYKLTDNCCSNSCLAY